MPLFNNNFETIPTVCPPSTLCVVYQSSCTIDKGIVELGVKIDGSSEHNLLPRSIASRLCLPLHFGKSIRVSITHHMIPTNQYCQFNIQVADVETTIDACVVSEGPFLLLGGEWIRQVNLLSGFGNHKYYIPGLSANLIPVLGLGAAVTTEAD
jgi:hypothetical protein